MRLRISVALVCLSVCLSVGNITQKPINGLPRNCVEGSGLVKGTSVQILMVIWCIFTVQFQIRPLLDQLCRGLVNADVLCSGITTMD